MTMILRIPPNTQAYLFAKRDVAKDKFDVTKFRYNYGNESEESFPPAWAYWKMEEATGDRIDATGNGHDISEAGFAHYPVMDTGKIGNAVKFPGDGYSGGPRLVGNHDLSFADDLQFTMAFWVKSNHQSTGSWIDYFGISLDNVSYRSSVWAYIRGSNSLYGTDALFIVANIGEYQGDDWIWEGLKAQTEPTSYLLEPDTWHFVCFYYDGTGLYLEIDNELVDSALGKHGITYPFDRVEIGRPLYNGANSWCDEAGIWLQALTPAQRAQLYNSGAGWSPY